ncbi:putative nuclease HARBI1 [Condylostylus longicornis]|uniref:putative nuclease HARBI1 n=1 Tax=Condylostylus longicornis TaxID=2530218 RepID=UPI00244E29D6|nr:putative nuclease HARBI1 [Condylostylus longicornis]
MERSTFQYLLKQVKPMWKKKATGRIKLKLEVALLMTIWRLATGCSFRELSNLFNVGRGATFSAYLEVVKILFNMKNKFVKWPYTEEAQQKCCEDFQNLRKNPIPFVIGCIDGCHIQISAPKNDSISYFNRKQVHSMVLQAVCDSNLKFIDVFFGCPGSCHDAAVWENSPLAKDVKTGKRKLFNESFLLGDSAYPLSKFLIVRYRDNGFLTDQQNRFNYIHSSTRVIIEQAFGRLKTMFRILHNLIIDYEGIQDFNNDDDLNFVEPNIDDAGNKNVVDSDEGGEIRDRLAMLFCS